MGRARAFMERIERKKARGMTFENRGASLKKKVYELSTLCDVEVCLIIFSPGDGDDSVEPKSWPDNPQEIHNLIETFKKCRANDGRCKITDPSFYFKDRTKKADGDLAKLRKKTVEAKFPTWGGMYEYLSDEEMRKLADLLKAKLEAITKRVDFIKGFQSFPTETTGNVMINSLCEFAHSPHQSSSYMIQNQNFSDATTNSLVFEFHQQPPRSSFLSNVHCTQNSISFLPMANPGWLTHTVPNQFPPLMDGGGASSSNTMVFHKSPAQYNLEPLKHVDAALDNNDETGKCYYNLAALEHMGPAVDNGDETSRCFYAPAMQQAPSHLLHFLPSGAPTQLEHIGAAVDKGDETARCYYGPAIDQALHFLPSGAPTQMNAPRTGGHYGGGYSQFMDPT